MYTFARESFEETYPEVEPLYRQHYAEMCERLEGLGQPCSPYNPRLDVYRESARRGDLLTFIVRYDGAVIGYTNVYLTGDMHNGDLIAEEDTIFITRAHRNGVGKKLVKYGIDQLRALGVKRLNVTAVTDLRVAKLWKRMGFKEVATQMTFVF